MVIFVVGTVADNFSVVVLFEVAPESAERSIDEMGFDVTWAAGRVFIEDLKENLDLGFDVDLILEREPSSWVTRCYLLDSIRKVVVANTYFFAKPLIVSWEDTCNHCFGYCRTKFSYAGG